MVPPQYNPPTTFETVFGSFQLLSDLPGSLHKSAQDFTTEAQETLVAMSEQMATLRIRSQVLGYLASRDSPRAVDPNPLLPAHAHAPEEVASFLCEPETEQGGKGKERLSQVQRPVLLPAFLQSQASTMQINHSAVTQKTLQRSSKFIQPSRMPTTRTQSFRTRQRLSDKP